MGYVTKNLMENEEVRYQTKIHKIIFFTPLIYFIFAYLFNLVPCGENDAIGCDTKEIILAVITIIAVLSLIVRLIKYIFTEFAITSRRIIHKTGFIRRETWELLLSKVESVQVDQGIFARIIGYGAIDVSGTGGSSDPVKLIRRPLEFRMKAQEEIEKVQSNIKSNESSTDRTEESHEDSSEEKLTKLKELFDKELINEDEYNQKRQEVIDSI